MKLKLAAAAAFLAAIVAANYATSHWGMIPVGFGLTASAGTLFAGLTFGLRDAIHDRHNPWPVITLITVGALISFLMGGSLLRIAVASGAAFLLSELADMAVYQPLERRGQYRAVLASNVVGAVIDTVLFLSIAAPVFEQLSGGAFSVAGSVPGQLVGKFAMTAVALVALKMWRMQTPVNDLSG